MPGPGPIQSVSRAAAVLRLFATGQCQFGLSDTAAALGLPKGTVHGILHTLRQEGLVEQDSTSGKYRLGAELVRLGGSYRQRHELLARALPWADDLARTTAEAVHVGVPHRSGVLIIHHVLRPFRPDETRQVLETGMTVAFEGTALGAILDAPRTPAGLLEVTLERDWACAPGPGDGVVSLAAPIRDRRDAVAAVSITGAAARICDGGEVRGSLVSAVRNCARAISHDLGADRPPAPPAARAPSSPRTSRTP
ncbi:IclR family transcriptional regulator [Streptomyces fulvoviolaceus]|uniref:IclR family transcriptional regulator n=1 Tax=Streptomyces fulvoviolaceus TaxID=285535 RepID=UPI0021C03E2B|nr:IclR family transcriptional regulator [Streptomyces fulvoviolaceus]MCT9077577.1 IclR family transcriptional regulator [Streptomyces fulvoviolaceus]